MTENKNVELVEVPELTQRDKVETYFRSTFLLGSFNFERMQSIGFAVSMIPAIKRFYTKKEDQAEALTRHLEFFNTQPWVASSIMGVTAAMEREKAAGKDIDEAAITNVKVGLMGPLAGVGDPIFWGTARMYRAGGSGRIPGGDRQYSGPAAVLLRHDRNSLGNPLVRLQVRLREGHPDCDRGGRQHPAEDYSGRLRDGPVRDGCSGVPLDEREHSVATD